MNAVVSSSRHPIPPQTPEPPLQRRRAASVVGRRSRVEHNGKRNCGQGEGSCTLVVILIYDIMFSLVILGADASKD